MATSTAEQMRAWRGPAILTYGFRPFFLGGATWAALAMAGWVSVLAGALELPTAFDPVSWHAHEFLFGTLGAIIAGFLLTAVPNWTGRLPVTGWALGGLAVLWLAGRLAIAVSADLPAGLAAGIDLLFPVVLGAVILREIVVGKNWRNLPVLGLLAVFTLANALFHIDAAGGHVAAEGIGVRLGLGAVIMMISLIGGRIVPSFTRNWLVTQKHAARPAPPMQRFDKAVMLFSIAALVLWVGVPSHPLTGVALVVMGLLQAARLARWCGWHVRSEPLVWVLHVAYAFIALGALALGIAILAPDTFGAAAAQHLWMAGAVGMMTLAVMTRATLGHTGRALTAGPGTVALYVMMILSVLARICTNALPQLPMLELAALLWIGAFGGYAVLYGPLLLRAKPNKS
ncbi:NnrS family protein [Oceaniglobus indicus]|uniref:NnrS family protein n=1 Tax=Oceaniglobus indicus TaxID=2047749 RepID=UPI000C1986DB|nr:NnrS family protein [Oceaniglobus indicus]